MAEKHVEEKLRIGVKEKGGRAYKFVSPGNQGVPDRIVLLPGGVIDFIELKDKGKKPTALQLNQHTKLRALGFNVLVIDSKEGVDEYLASR